MNKTPQLSGYDSIVPLPNQLSLGSMALKSVDLRIAKTLDIP
ncbi:hypothetical protein [Coleofasciculus sp. G2-EDA-02]